VITASVNINQAGLDVMKISWPPVAGRVFLLTSPFIEQAAPLGLKRFEDGLFYKQAVQLLGPKKPCLRIYSRRMLSFYLQKSHSKVSETGKNLP
jgi:hypothetical protein